MMELLIFLVLLFGIFGVILTQYISQYRKAYNLWDTEIVFKKNCNDEHQCNFCSLVESYSRELCELHDVISSLIFLIGVVLTIVLLAIRAKLDYLNFKIQIVDFRINTNYYSSFDNAQQLEIQNTFFCLILTLSIFFIIPILLNKLKICITDFSGKSKKDSIDRKLFDAWWKRECHREKNEDYIDNGQPSQLYIILAEKIKNKDVQVKDATEDEIQLVKKLYPWMFKLHS